jgi:hypothetical protein
VLCPRCSRRRPWQVRICAPARSSILAYSTVLFTSLKMRNLAVTGTSRFSWRILTTAGWPVSAGALRSRRARTHAVDEIPLVLEEGAVAALLRDVLRAAEVEVDGVARALDEPRRREQLVGVVRAELN